MTTIAEVHTLVSNAISRGTAFNTEIPTYAAQAVRKLERNFSFQHMKKLKTFTIDHTATYPRFLELPNTRVKSIRNIRIPRSDGTILTLQRAEPTDFTQILAQEPTHYWPEGDQRLVLNNTPQETYTLCELRYVEYTDWSTTTANSNWWTDNASALMAAETVITMHPRLKDDTLFASMKLIRDEELKTVLDADEDATTADLNEVMNYTINYDLLYQFNSTS